MLLQHTSTWTFILFSKVLKKGQTKRAHFKGKNQNVTPGPKDFYKAFDNADMLELLLQDDGLAPSKQFCESHLQR